MCKIFKRGFYGGKFLPFHNGHKFCIKRALEDCEELVVILFYGSKDEDECLKKGCGIDNSWLLPDKRISIINEWTKQYAKLRFAALDDAFIHNEAKEQGLSDWECEIKYIKASVGFFDAVYSSEPQYDAFFKKSYPFAQHILIDAKRENVPISGTMLRNMRNPADYLKWII